MRRGFGRRKKNKLKEVNLEDYSVEEESKHGDDLDERGIADTAYEDDVDEEMNNNVSFLIRVESEKNLKPQNYLEISSWNLNIFDDL